MTQHKRNITNEEIEYVIGGIQPISCLEPAVASRICDRIRDVFRRLLSNQRIYPAILDKLRDRITQQYYSTQVSPGEAVGILTAQSVGERQTQLALDSFHSTGITTATVVTGVPRFNELVNATKNPRHVVTNVYLKHPYPTIQETREMAGVFLTHVTFKQIARDYTLFKNPKPNDLPDWYTTFRVLYPQHFPDAKFTHLVRFNMHTSILFNSKIRLYQVAKAIMVAYNDLMCVWSPDSVGVLDVWLDTEHVAMPDIEYIEYINEENLVDSYCDEIVVPNLNPITIRGIEGIKQVAYIQSDNQWHIEAVGFNLKALFANELVDETRTTSNHMWEIYNTLGIEATRAFLIQEFLNVVSVDSYINQRHIQLLVDTMLYTGSISSISRYGVRRNESEPLTKCSFEESLDQILKAGIYGERENVAGVSSAIICGKVSRIGTGICDLVYKPN